MKRNAVIKLNDIEYTLELNRDSFIQIDKICNIDESMKLIGKNFYEYVDDIDDNYNPLENAIDEAEVERLAEEKVNVTKKMYERAFFIWLYPNHQLNISQIRELIDPYLEDDEKAEYISYKFAEFMKDSISIRNDYNKEKLDKKNLEALVNK